MYKVFVASRNFGKKITQNYKNLNSLCRFLGKLGYENIGFSIDTSGCYVFTTTSEKISSDVFLTKDADLSAINSELSGKEVYALCVFLEKKLELKMDYRIGIIDAKYCWVLFENPASQESDGF